MEEAEKLEVEGIEGLGELKRREAMLLDVEEEVACTAEAVEVVGVAQAGGWMVAGERQDVLSSGPDAVGLAGPAMLGGEGARSDHVGTAALAVQADAQEPTGRQVGQEASPARHGVCEVVEDASGLDEVEGAIALVEGLEGQDVGVEEAEVGDAASGGLGGGSSQAGAGEVEGQHLALGEARGRADGVLAGPAPRDQDLQRAREVGQVDAGQGVPDEVFQGCGGALLHVDQARVGVGFVLGGDRLAGGIVAEAEAVEGGADAARGQGRAHGVGEQGAQGAGRWGRGVGQGSQGGSGELGAIVDGIGENVVFGRAPGILGVPGLGGQCAQQDEVWWLGVAQQVVAQRREQTLPGA